MHPPDAIENFICHLSSCIHLRILTFATINKTINERINEENLKYLSPHKE